MSHRVVVTGGAAISALGDSWSAVSGRLQQLTNAVRYMPEWEVYPELRTRIAAPVDHFELPAHYTKKKIRSMGRVAMFGVRATELALESAQLNDKELLSSGRVGVSYGSSTGSSPAALEFFSMLENHSMERLNTTTYLRMMSHTAAVNISVYFGTTGRVYTTNSACTAGSQGIGYAYEAIKSGLQDVMLAGGSEELCPTQAAVFDTILAASVVNDDPAATPKPFAAGRDGLVLGEGGCTLILESLEHAQARGAPVLAEVVGYGTNADGAHVVRPQLDTMAQVMELALADAAIDRAQIGYISAHGTATEHGDSAESHATERVLGRNIPISSLKSYTGHTLGSCGAFEAWTGIMMMREGWFAPTLNLDSIDPGCAALDYIADECRQLDTHYFISNNFAFGGINTSLLFKKWTQ